MNFNFQKFCDDYELEIAPDDHKHARPGWIQIECPLCTGNPGYHLGYNEEGDYFNCWRCGWHKHIDVVSKLLNCSEGQAKGILRTYKWTPTRRSTETVVEPVLRRTVSNLPINTTDLTNAHKRYLKRRGFSPKKLQRIWKLKGTNSMGYVKLADGTISWYKFRIIAPIFFEGKLVSYQGRDITEKSKLKYKACPKELEARDHKHCLYGLDLVEGDSVVVCEGITDTWRLGPGAVATFGVEYTTAQLKLLTRFRRRFILFDAKDPAAIKQAKKLAGELKIYSGTSEVIDLTEGDPGSMTQSDAVSLMNELGVR